MHANRILGAAVTMWLAACAPAIGTMTPSPSPAFATATLAGAIESTPTVMAEAIASTPTLVLTTGTATTQVNVRREPTAAGSILATLKAGETVQIVSRDPGGNWYQIVFDGGEGGRAWIAAQYIQVPDQGAVPTVGGGTLASVREQINVRSGPGTQFDALGLLKADDAVTLTGKDSSGTWLQIAYASGADGKGWVAAAFLETGSMDTLPVVAETGEVLGISTPTVVAAVPTPTAAVDDGDSLEAPAFSARFNPRSLSSVFYASDVSWPQGDGADWIGFTPYFDAVTITLDCHGAIGLAGEILSDGNVMAGTPSVFCGGNERIELSAGEQYVLRVRGGSDDSQNGYVSYTVSIIAMPGS